MTWNNLVVPVAVERVSFDFDLVPLSVGNLAAFSVIAFVQPTVNFQSLVRPC